MNLIQPFHCVPLRNALLVLALCVGTATLSGCGQNAEAAAQAAAEAQFHFQSNNLPAARQRIRDAIEERDDMPELHLLRGRIELAAGDRAAAFSAYSEALALDPVNTEALQGVSQLGLSTGNFDQSIDATDRILVLSPGQPDALLVRGLHALIRRRYPAAIADANRVLESQPGNENARVLKARALFMAGRPTDALAAIGGEGGGTGTVPSEATALTRLEIFRELRNADGMAAEFARLRNLRPDDPGLRLDEANFLFKRGDETGANALMVRTLTGINPETQDAREVAVQTTRLWDEYGFDGVTNAQWEQIATAAPQPAREVVARFLLRSNALPAAERLVTGLSGDPRTALEAQLANLRGQHAQALRAAGTVLAHDKTNCDALVARSQALRALGRAEGAVASGQQAAGECPDRVETYFAAAAAYDAWGRTEAVDRVYAQAIDAQPQNLALARQYAGWLLAENRGREAVAILRRFTRDSPASLAAWTLYGEVCAKARRSCAREVAAGRAGAATRYGVDLPPGQLQPNGLFGRFVTR